MYVPKTNKTRAFQCFFETAKKERDRLCKHGFHHYFCLDRGANCLLPVIDLVFSDLLDLFRFITWLLFATEERNYKTYDFRREVLFLDIHYMIHNVIEMLIVNFYELTDWRF